MALAAMAGMAVWKDSNIAAIAAPADSVPFVGCASDGQMGPVAPPALQTLQTGMLHVPPSQANRFLAYYASTNLGVLAPRGWHCAGVYGSNGAALFVTPEKRPPETYLRQGIKLTGPAIQLSFAYGDTSGRFEVAGIAGRIFPAAHDFVQGVINEGLAPRNDFSFTPFPDDRLVRGGPTEVEFETPANRDGLGTYSLLARSDQPIAGVAILEPGEMNLVLLNVRLPPGLRRFSSAIVQNVERNKGNPLGGEGSP